MNQALDEVKKEDIDFVMKKTCYVFHNAAKKLSEPKQLIHLRNEEKTVVQ